VSAHAALLADAAAALLAAGLRWTVPFLLVWCVTRLPVLSAATRHRLWLALLLGLAALPLAGRYAPSIALDRPVALERGREEVVGLPARPPVPEPPAAVAAAAVEPPAGVAVTRAAGGSVPAPPAAPVRFPAGQLLGSVWALGALLLLAYSALGHLSVGRLAHASGPARAREGRLLDEGARRLGCRRRPELRISEREWMPMTWGVLRPVVLLPARAAGWDEGRLRRVLLHELAHVRRADVATQALARCVCSVFWFHPAAWAALRALRSEAEIACDDAVLLAEGDPIPYADDLLRLSRELAAPRLALATLPMARTGELPGRIRSLLSLRRRRGQSARAAAVATAAVALLVAAAGAVRWADARTTGRDGDWLAGGSLPDGRLVWSMDCGARPDALCRSATAGALALLERTGRTGAIVTQRVGTGEVVAYAAVRAAGAPRDEAIPLSSPGSIAKLPLAALWWEAGHGDEPVPCPAALVLPSGRRVGNAGGGDHGAVDAGRMLAISCNTAAIGIGERLAQEMGDGFAGALRRFGFAAPADLALPVVDPTFWGPTASGREWSRPRSPAYEGGGARSRADDVLLAGAGIGGARTTPLHVSRFLQAVGNGGVLLPPRPIAATGEAAAGTRILREDVADRLVRAMSLVVREGTASRTLPQLEWSRWSLAGKTGTAGRTGVSTTDAWFAGLLHDEHGTARFTVVVLVEEGGTGGGVAAGIAAEMTRLFARLSGSEL
jgi:beta-lactamase regulating signal transducer with metallopeptidase domain